MIEDCISKTHRVMTYAAILGGHRMGGRHPNRIDAVIPIMAIGARLRCRVDQCVVENTAEAKARYVMTNAAVDGCIWMADRLTRYLAHTVAGVTAFTNYFRTGVVWEGRRETFRSMAETTLYLGNYMAFMLTCGHSPIVAAGAYARNIRMIKAAVWF